MTDPHQYDDPGMSGPARDAAAVATSDTSDLTTTPRALWIGTGGDVKVDMRDSGTVTFSNVPDGTLLPVVVTRVYATGTTADDILAIW